MIDILDSARLWQKECEINLKRVPHSLTCEHSLRREPTTVYGWQREKSDFESK